MHAHTQTKHFRAGAVVRRKVSNKYVSVFEFYLTKPDSTSTHWHTARAHSKDRAVTPRHVAGGVVKPTLPLIRVSEKQEKICSRCRTAVGLGASVIAVGFC